MLSAKRVSAASRRFHQWQQRRNPTWSVTPTRLPPSGCSSFKPRSWEKGLLGWYVSMIETRPVLTKSTTAGVIFAAADVTSQMIAKEDFLLSRTVRMGGYGMLILGPMLHQWFNLISRILPKRDIMSTLKKIFAGQLVFGPIMTAIFFSTNAILLGECSGEIIGRLKRDLVPTMRNGVVYWALADFITFKFIPVGLQPIICNAFSFFWTIYLTQVANLKTAASGSVG